MIMPLIALIGQSLTQFLFNRGDLAIARREQWTHLQPANHRQTDLGRGALAALR